jgi:asparagine synthetase B (glutamine-hydrolysing)
VIASFLTRSTVTAEDGAEFRQRLRAFTEANLTGEPVALLFSGGTDSLTVLWSLLDCGITPHCYTFRLERKVSDDSKVARIAAETFGVPLTEIVIPHRGPATLLEEVRSVVQAIGSARKTHVECSFPFWHLAQQISEPVIFTGIGADDLWGSAKSVAIKYGKDPAGFNQSRHKIIADPSTSAIKQINGLLNHRMILPYREPSVTDFMLQFSWSALNRPKQKMLAVQGFSDEYQRAAIYRRNNNLQVGSGIREYLAMILQTPEIRRYKNVQQAYKALLSGR